MILAAAAVAAVSVSAGLYLINHPLRRGAKAGISVEAPEPSRIVSPHELLKKSAHTASGTSSGAGEHGSELTSRTAIYPVWRACPWRLETTHPITAQGGYIAPVWSPIGLDVAFTRLNAPGIFIAGPNGGSTRMLSDDQADSEKFSWNLDGMSLRVRQPDGRHANLMITGEKYPAIEQQARVYEAENAIYFQPEDGDPRRISGPEDVFSSPHLSPDGTKVAYEGRETGIYITHLDGSRTVCAENGRHPAWMPDGSGIIYDAGVYDGAQAVDSDLWYASAETDERANLTKSPGVPEAYPSVAPDGDRVAFSCAGAIYIGRIVK